MVHATPYPWPYDGSLTPAKTALVLVAAQQAFAGLDPTGRVRGACVQLRQATERAGVGLVLVRLGRTPATPARIASIPVVGSSGWASLAGCEPDSNTLVVEAPALDGFYGTGLDAGLWARGISHLLLAGFASHRGMLDVWNVVALATLDVGHDIVRGSERGEPFVDASLEDGELLVREEIAHGISRRTRASRRSDRRTYGADGQQRCSTCSAAPEVPLDRPCGERRRGDRAANAGGGRIPRDHGRARGSRCPRSPSSLEAALPAQPRLTLDAAGEVTATYDMSGVTVEDARRNEIIVAGTGAGSETDTYPVILNEVLKTRFKLITGYLGTKETIMAMESGEAHGRCSFALAAIKITRPDWISEKKINYFFQLAPEKSRDLPDVPLVFEFINDPADRQLLELMVATKAIALPFAAPPGVPPAGPLTPALAAGLETDKTLISGDIVESKLVPTMLEGTSSVKGWLAILDAVEKLQARYVVPDHGDLGDGSLVGKEKTFITDIRDAAVTLKKQGVSVDDAGKRVTESMKAKYSDYPNIANVPNVVRRVYAEY